MVGSVESMGMLVSGAAKKVGVCIINSPLCKLLPALPSEQRLSEDDNFTDDVLHFINLISNSQVSNEKTPGWLGYVGDYTIQLYRDYNKPL